MPSSWGYLSVPQPFMCLIFSDFYLFPKNDTISLNMHLFPSSPKNIHLFSCRVVVSWNLEQVMLRKWRVLEMMHLFSDIAVKVHFLEKGNR